MEDNVCNLCDRRFPSVKSLHGHMRWHPDRPYRGMRRPPYADNFDISDYEEHLLSGWSEFEVEIAVTLSQFHSNVIDHSSVSESKIHVCSMCNRSFSSHQALGGHVAAHNKVKNSNDNLEEGEILPESGNISFNNEIKMSSQKIIKSPSEHRCKRCNHLFTSGQALGGHMRTHWLRLQNNNYQPAQQNNDQSAPVEIENNGDNSFKFDLNVAPEIIKDEEEYEAKSCNPLIL